jgi:hypothetical protein
LKIIFSFSFLESQQRYPRSANQQYPPSPPVTGDLVAGIIDLGSSSSNNSSKFKPSSNTSSPNNNKHFCSIPFFFFFLFVKDDQINFEELIISCFLA